MARKTPSRKLGEIHQQALRRFDQASNYNSEVRRRSALCRKFTSVPGGQWLWDEEGDFGSRMKLEINKTALAVTRILNEYRNNRISAEFMPKDGGENSELSDICAGRYRADTYDAAGRQARDNAFDELVTGGMGAWRLRADYEDKRKGHQRVCSEPISDAALRVYFDDNSKMEDKSDAAWAFLLTPTTKEAFANEWGTEAASFPVGIEYQPTYQWFQPDQVIVAEYFVKAKGKDTMRVFTAFDGTESEYLASDLTEEEAADLLATGLIEGESYSVEMDEVRKYTLCGSKVLRDDGVIAGRNIPVIVGYAHRRVIDGVEYFEGHAQKPMDTQIILNVQASSVYETSAESPVRVPIFAAEQIAKYQNMWDSSAKYRYRLADPILDNDGNPVAFGPSAYLEPPNIPEATATLLGLSDAHLQDLLGNPMNAETLQPNQSGVAMEMVQARIDVQTSGYLDALAKAERRAAEVWLSMAADLYHEEGRMIKTMTEEGKRGSAEVRRPMLDEKTGEIRHEMDFADHEMEVIVDVGPASAARRRATQRTITALMGVITDPETLQVLSMTALRNTDGEGMQTIRDYARKKLVSMGVEEPNKEEKAEMEAAQAPAPDGQAALAAALATESQAKALKAAADAELAKARTEQAKAQTAETLAGIPISQQKAAIEGVNAIQQGMMNNG
jgi:hypothetical protein